MKSKVFELQFISDELGTDYPFKGVLTTVFEIVLTKKDKGYVETVYEGPHARGPKYNFHILEDGTAVFERNLIDLKKPVADKMRDRVKELLPKRVIGF